MKTESNGIAEAVIAIGGTIVFASLCAVAAPEVAIAGIGLVVLGVIASCDNSGGGGDGSDTSAGCGC